MNINSALIRHNSHTQHNKNNSQGILHQITSRGSSTYFDSFLQRSLWRLALFGCVFAALTPKAASFASGSSLFFKLCRVLIFVSFLIGSKSKWAEKKPGITLMFYLKLIFGPIWNSKRRKEAEKANMHTTNQIIHFTMQIIKGINKFLTVTVNTKINLCLLKQIYCTFTSKRGMWNSYLDCPQNAYNNNGY